MVGVFDEREPHRNDRPNWIRTEAWSSVWEANRSAVERAKKTTTPREQKAKQQNHEENHQLFVARVFRTVYRALCVCWVCCCVGFEFASLLSMAMHCTVNRRADYATTHERLVLDSIQKSLSGARSVFHFRFLSWFWFVHFRRNLGILTLHSDYRHRNTLYELCCFTNSVSLSFEAGHTFRHPQTPNLSRSLIWNDFTFVRILEVKPWPTKASTQHFRFQFYLHHENRVMWTVTATATASNPSLLYGIQLTEFHWTFDHGHDKNTRSIILIYETTTISYRIFFSYTLLAVVNTAWKRNECSAQPRHIYISVFSIASVSISFEQFEAFVAMDGVVRAMSNDFITSRVAVFKSIMCWVA